ncbi:Uncharacterised protein [Actinomyces viscosus]|uniref:Uncharacterized protein n=1 Tax=Actinomyces viscosus TaxID=1656 RepID=A0A3S4VD08_ACTVI|nr:Uncharacterised protein [Actinomyces viscosus]
MGSKQIPHSADGLHIFKSKLIVIKNDLKLIFESH